MSKHQMATLILTTAMWLAIVGFAPQYRIWLMPFMPADGSVPPLPAPIEVGPGHIAPPQ